MLWLSVRSKKKPPYITAATPERSRSPVVTLAETRGGLTRTAVELQQVAVVAAGRGGVRPLNHALAHARVRLAERALHLAHDRVRARAGPLQPGSLPASNLS